ncbi:tRNA (guanosine(37)-N1)-methyltransferase TrmD [Candidatus Pseudothioglobus singularis]|nr:tRNA (guanosine(37)-N1)-methyltransferase TrmD [Candidatus Pseudothioglobus singularis]MDA8854853.1 tRNA (guanosine(37)-N1)-methyltransferase TrmD [Candidatus Pseudothioglobus singularis]MDC0597008.1 tRNA (guanosine(37)-N1)-methyltransferase TrmD [Candidatus Pseudothioglobus singularis]
MRFDIITLFPEMFSAIKEEGVIARAIKKSIISINEWQLRDFSQNKYKNVDDKAYGGGAGMVMQVKPIRDCIKKIKEQEPETKVIYLSPQGEPLNQNLVEKLSSFESLTLLCGRYEGVDERIIKNDVDLEVSIGDYVISGGELAAMVLIDSVSRRLPNVLGNKDSLNDSFVNNLLDFPHYTRPESIDGDIVPEVLLSGNQAKIDAWRLEQAKHKTRQKRPDLLSN